MELLYEPQELKAGQLNHSFNEIANTEIIRPSWKGKRTYGDTFFVKKRKGVAQAQVNRPAGKIMDTIEINEVEYLLIFNGTNIEVAYFNGTEYVGLNLNYTRGDKTPSRFIKGKSGSGQIFDGITIEDTYIDEHNRGAWVSGTDYYSDDIVEFNSDLYIAILDSTNKVPDSDEAWKIYNNDKSGYDASDPETIEYRDVYKGSYLKVKLSKTNIRDIALIGRYILFSNPDSNLQGVTSEIHYTETTYEDPAGSTLQLPDNEIYVYIRGTNEHGTRPYITESVQITTNISFVPIIATEDKVISLHTETSLGNVIGAVPIVLYEASDGDEITDMAVYNGVSFILTKDKVIFSRTLLTSNINFYPLDSFLNLIGLERLVPFGKMLVIFGNTNAVIVPVIGTEGTEGYIYTDFHYNGTLYSKYSVLSTMGSLYVLQDDKQFVKLDITSENGIDYQAEVTNVIPEVRGLFDFIVGDIYMNEWDKTIYVLDVGPHGTYYYKYDIEYKHWDTGDYTTSFYKIEDKLYGDEVYLFNEEYFDDQDSYREEIVSFDFGGTNLHTLKQVAMVKMIFGLNEKILDYELEVEYQIGGVLHKITIDLKNYPINIELVSGSSGLGDSNLNETLLGQGTTEDETLLGNFVSVTVGLGITASVFNFKIKSKDNGFIYGGSIIGYTLKVPTVTEYNYKH